MAVADSSRPRVLEVDHVIPQRAGGQDDIENLQLLCAHCNRVKGTGLRSTWSPGLPGTGDCGVSNMADFAYLVLGYRETIPEVSLHGQSYRSSVTAIGETEPNGICRVNSQH